MVGGENLLEKAEAQQKLLEQTSKELQLRQLNEERLQTHLQRKEVLFILYIINFVRFIQIQNMVLGREVGY